MADEAPFVQPAGRVRRAASRRRAGRRLGRRADVLRGHGPPRPDRSRRPVLGRPHHARHPPRPDPRLRPGVPLRSSSTRRERAPEPLQLALQAAGRGPGDAAVVPATEPGTDDRGRAGGPARPDRLRRRGVARQVLRGVHAGRARRRCAGSSARLRLTPPRRRTRRTSAAPAGPAARPAPDGARDDAHARRAVELFWRRRRLRLRPLVLILDVSGSMADYSRNLLQFAHSTRRAAGRVEVFCFGTRLTRITRALERRRPDEALDAGRRAVFDWEGGTRIGDSLDGVRARLGSARHGPRRHRGDLLRRPRPRRPGRCSAAAMERLARLCHRVVWLNPHKGDDREFQPSTLGMMVAAPHVDLLAVRPRPAQPRGVRGAAARSSVRSAGEVECVVVAEGDRVMTREEIVELADAVAPHGGIASGIGTTRYGAQLVVDADDRDDASAGCREFFAPRHGRACRRGRLRRRGPRRGRRRPRPALDPARIARRLPVRRPAGARRMDPAGPRGRVRDDVQARRRRPSPTATQSIYVGHADDLSAERFPFSHPRAGCWIQRAGNRWKVTSARTRCRAGCRRTASRSPTSWPRSTGRAATSSSTTGVEGPAGSASTPRPRRRARSPPAAIRTSRLADPDRFGRRLTPTSDPSPGSGAGPVADSLVQPRAATP